MTEFVEGPVVELRPRMDEKAKIIGADVTLGQDGAKYYFDGQMPVPLGKPVRLEVQDSNERPGFKEILNCWDLAKTEKKAQPIPELHKTIGPPLPPPSMGMPPRMMMINVDDFNAMMKQQILNSEAKLRALDSASKIYPGMNKQEKDPEAAVADVIAMAKKLEAFLV